MFVGLVAMKWSPTAFGLSEKTLFVFQFYMGCSYILGGWLDKVSVSTAVLTSFEHLKKWIKVPLARSLLWIWSYTNLVSVKWRTLAWRQLGYVLFSLHVFRGASIESWSQVSMEMDSLFKPSTNIDGYNNELCK